MKTQLPFLSRTRYFGLFLIVLAPVIAAYGLTGILTAPIDPRDPSTVTPDTPPSGKCFVCHNQHTTIQIACNKVPKYLAQHPNDTSGQCTGVSNEKPPKP